MRTTTMLFASLVALFGCADQGQPTLLEPTAGAELSTTAVGGRAGALGVVYVSSQGLYYDTFVSAETLPPEGPFQKLVDGVTEYGPGDPGYLGGRWWVDVNGNDVQDPGDAYLLCPLLPPGRETP